MLLVLKLLIYGLDYDFCSKALDLKFELGFPF